MAEDLDAAPVVPPVEPVVEAPTEPADLEPGDLVDAEKAKGLIAALKATREEAKAALGNRLFLKEGVTKKSKDILSDKDK